MDKSDKKIDRRDFMRVLGGAIVAAEFGVSGCGDDARDSSSMGTISGQGGDFPGGIQTAPTGGMGAGATAGSSAQGSSGSAVTGGSSGLGSASSGSGGRKPTATGGSGGIKNPTTAGAKAGSSGSASKPDAGPVDSGKARVYVVKTTNRASGISKAIAMAGGLGFAAGRDVVLKPNFNSTYTEPPATTHDDTIRTIVAELKTAKAGNIILGESAGSTTASAAPTEAVIQAKGTLNLCNQLGIDFVSYDDPAVEVETFQFDGMTWAGGLAIPKLMRSDRVKILMPCCKTHMLGDYSFSLKLAVGLVPRSRRLPDMHLASLQEKVAEINKGFTPDLIIMDALVCFIDNGPDTGTTATPGLIVAGTDRVAIDAVGVAILKAAGCNTAPIRAKIFETRQIARAVALGLGATSPDDIELIGDDDATVSNLRSILDNG
jgi:uncharacterized protein (DUF362 family)